MSDLSAQVQRAIELRGLFRRGQKVVVAVSGGVDSMVLLRVLWELSRANAWKLTVAHLNHRLRGRSSDADERLVRRVARELKLPAVVERAEVRGFARANGLSLELAARELRHRFLARAAVKVKAPSIAVAHHADDQLELFFLRLLRGSGSEGLSGMKWVGPSPANSRLQLVRPLLQQTKADLRRFAAENKVGFREDASNACLDIQRNRIRHELLPLLRKKYQVGLDKTVPRVMDIFGAEGELVSQIARDWLQRKRTDFNRQPVAVQRRCLQIQLWKLGIQPDYELVEQLRRSPNRAVSVQNGSNGRGALSPSHLWVRRDASGRVRSDTPKGFVFKPGGVELAFKGRAGEAVFDGVRIQWQVRMRPPLGFRRSKSRKREEFFDADKVGLQILLRHWQSGDRFQPIGMRNPLKLQDFLTNRKVPRPRRHSLLLGVTGAGEVFWVEDQRISERFKLTKDTIRCLQWRWQPL